MGVSGITTAHNRRESVGVELTDSAPEDHGSNQGGAGDALPVGPLVENQVAFVYLVAPVAALGEVVVGQVELVVVVPACGQVADAHQVFVAIAVEITSADQAIKIYTFKGFVGVEFNAGQGMNAGKTASAGIGIEHHIGALEAERFLNGDGNLQALVDDIEPWYAFEVYVVREIAHGIGYLHDQASLIGDPVFDKGLVSFLVAQIEPR